jgi:uncharacterized protein DUF6384
MNEVVVKEREQAPLDELMLAMDVVDTLRHRELVLAREVQAEDRDRELLVRLREIYTSQGIEVTDDVLSKGVQALREDRFVYEGAAPSLSRTLATLYVTRGRWGKWVGGLGVLAVVALLAFQFFIRGPELRQATEVPASLQGAYQGVVISTQDPAVLGDARALLATGEAAVQNGDFAAARDAVGDLRTLADQLQLQGDVRIVSRPGEESGFFRIPDDNPRARNYYVVVEAIAPNGRPVPLTIRNEEQGGRAERVAKWALHVDEATFNRVRADKLDDGIIQQNVVGTKRRGELDPQYSMATTGAITRW